MQRRKFIRLGNLAIAGTWLAAGSARGSAPPVATDVCVYGGTAAGAEGDGVRVVAILAVARLVAVAGVERDRLHGLGHPVVQAVARIVPIEGRLPDGTASRRDERLHRRCGTMTMERPGPRQVAVRRRRSRQAFSAAGPGAERRGHAHGLQFVLGSHTRLFCASRKPWLVGCSSQISSFLIVVGAPEE